MGNYGGNLSVPLEKKTDQHKKGYYVGKLKFPGNINCKDGVIFFVFVSESGEEELQISTLKEAPTHSQNDE
jgi:hypothetical protein